MKAARAHKGPSVERRSSCLEDAIACVSMQRTAFTNEQGASNVRWSRRGIIVRVAVSPSRAAERDRSVDSKDDQEPRNTKQERGSTE